MKERKFAKKLVLNKETIASLSIEGMNALRAGAEKTGTWTGECCTSYVNCENRY